MPKCLLLKLWFINLKKRFKGLNMPNQKGFF